MQNKIDDCRNKMIEHRLVNGAQDIERIAHEMTYWLGGDYASSLSVVKKAVGVS